MRYLRGRHRTIVPEPGRLTVVLKSADELSTAEIADCYEIAERVGMSMPAGFLEDVHFSQRPTVVLALRGGRVVGFQSHSLYWFPTPFFGSSATPVVYGGIALEDPDIAGSGVAHRMIRQFMRRALGPYWMFREYVFVAGTSNPRLIHLMSTQLRLHLPLTSAVRPEVVEFIRALVSEKRHVVDPISDRLLRRNFLAGQEVTPQWPTLYRARDEGYNSLALRLGLIREKDGRYFLGEYFLYLVGSSSRRRVVAACWLTGRSWFTRRLRPLLPRNGGQTR